MRFLAKLDFLRNHQLLAFNSELAAELEIADPDFGTESGAEESVYADDDLAQFFSGQKILPGSEPLSQAYAGYQFGQPVAQLGDGRAHYLGETNGFELQLKGSGRTAFSRDGDGRSSLGPVIREYLVSEAMAALGVPTTRALAAVRTGEEVVRQFGPEPGGVFTRVAPTHVRVGTFQYFAFKNDWEAIEILLKYVIERFYPELQNLSVGKQCIGLLQSLTCRQAELIARWKSLGFIHGVMNTDNFSIIGITIDYGPCAFMDQFSYDKAVILSLCIISNIERYKLALSKDNNVNRKYLSRRDVNISLKTNGYKFSFKKKTKLGNKKNHASKHPSPQQKG